VEKVIQLYGVLHPEEGVSRPATFIIDPGGLVRFQHVGKNVADRPSPVLLLNNLRWL
jgi:alkyl hydroperoxide reductase subunit AhpC